MSRGVGPVEGHRSSSLVLRSGEKFFKSNAEIAHFRAILLAKLKCFICSVCKGRIRATTGVVSSMEL